MKIRAHGCDINDIRNDNGEKVFSQSMKVSSRAAFELMRDSVFVETNEEYAGDDAFYRNAGLINKGFVILEASRLSTLAIYNHDGRYYLHTATDCETILEWLREQVRMGLRGGFHDALTEEYRLATYQKPKGFEPRCQNQNCSDPCQNQNCTP